MTTPELTSVGAPYAGRRPLRIPMVERHRFEAADGTVLQLHRAQGGDQGTVILAPGTAMSGLAFFLDTTDENLVEFLVARGLDVWALDWRTSPELEAHRSAYTFDDVARFDWPAAIATVRQRAQVDQVAVFAHCLSAPPALLSLARGYLDPAYVKGLVLSQVGAHFAFNAFGSIKRWGFVDRILEPEDMLHFDPETVGDGFADRVISLLTPLVPRSYDEGTPVMHRHSATFGDLLHVPRVSQRTMDCMGFLIPEVTVGFLRDAAQASRATDGCALSDDDLSHLDRLACPITLVHGEKNETFVPEATERTWKMLVEANGPDRYRRVVFANYGHLDCIVGDDAAKDVYPTLADALA